MKKRNTRRKTLISNELKGLKGPLLLAELRSLVHRKEMEPKEFREFGITDSYSHSFNRTVREMSGTVNSYKIQPTINKLFIGLIARVLILQCVKKGLYRNFPTSGALPRIILFEEFTRSAHPIGPIVGMRWISGVILSSKGKVRHISSALASYQPTFVSSQPPTWGDLQKLSVVPWEIGILTEEGITLAPSRSLLCGTDYHNGDGSATFTIESSDGFGVERNIIVDRSKTRPPREVSFTSRRRLLQKSIRAGVSFRDCLGDEQTLTPLKNDEVDLVKNSLEISDLKKLRKIELQNRLRKMAEDRNNIPFKS